MRKNTVKVVCKINQKNNGKNALFQMKITLL